jgi:CRP-like cAMP-binding protein
MPINLFRNADDLKVFPAGTVIFREGEPGDMMYVVADGEVEISVHNHVVETAGVGGIVGEMALIDNKPRSATVIAKTDCKLAPVDQKRFSFLIQQTPFFAIEVMQVMADRLRRWGNGVA